MAMMESYQRGIVLLVATICVFSIVSFHYRSSSQVLTHESSPANPQIRRNLDTLDTANFGTAKTLAQSVLSLIYNRYELGGPIGSQFFNSANNIGANTWNILKYKYAIKMLKPNSTFLMTFGGSSVTAGHDNYYNQSYPYIVKKRMAPILAALGVKLEVHNIAQGANNCVPYTFCYESMGGMNADFIGWEQSYNCGHDDPIFELTARFAGWSSEMGVVYYSASGAWSPSDCPESTDKVPYSSEEWTPEIAGLKPWLPGPNEVEKMKATLDKYNTAKSSASRFYGNWGKGSEYRGVGAHGFNVWEANPLCETKKDGKAVKGCNGIDAAQKCAMKFMTKEASTYGSDNGRGANWHPTRAFHMLRGEAITWLYSMILLDSIYMVEQDLQTKTKDVLLAKYTSELKKIHPPLPTPKKCMNYHCDLRPMCYTDYQPHYQPGQRLSDIIVGRHNWTYDDAELGEWSLHYGFLDAKPVYKSEGPTHGEIHLKVSIKNSNYVLICGAIKESLLHATVYVDMNIANATATYVPTDKRVQWSKRKYLGSECKYLMDLPKGDHVISISPNPEHPKHITGLSHVITWP